MAEGRTSTLPRLSTSSTSISSCFSSDRMSALPRVSQTQNHISLVMPKVYEVYPPRLTSAPEIPKRPVNPLHPPNTRRNHMLETTAPHWHNDMRSARMKQREHYRYHNAWSKYYYGSAAEQETYRAYNRSVLKQQMDDKWSSDRKAQVDKVQESELAVQKDNKCRMDDAMEHVKRSVYLQSFRDENKRIMDFQRQDHRRFKVDEDCFDREIMRYNPINWSGSLK